MGKWMVQQSFKAALGLMTSDMGTSRKREKKRQENDSDD